MATLGRKGLFWLQLKCTGHHGEDSGRSLKQLLTLCSHSVHTTKVCFSFSVHRVRGRSQGPVPSTMGRPSHPHYHNQGNPSQACEAIFQVMPGSVQLTAKANVTLAPSLSQKSLVLTFLHFSPRGALFPLPLPLENACLSFSGETRKQPQGTGMSTCSLQELSKMSLLWQS